MYRSMGREDIPKPLHRYYVDLKSSIHLEVQRPVYMLDLVNSRYLRL